MLFIIKLFFYGWKYVVNKADIDVDIDVDIDIEISCRKNRWSKKVITVIKFWNQFFLLLLRKIAALSSAIASMPLGWNVWKEEEEWMLPTFFHRWIYK